MRSDIFIPIYISLLFTSCQMYLPTEESISESAPQAYEQPLLQKEATRVNLESWWQEFGSDELNNLMDELVNGNLTIKESIARLRQFDSLRKIASSEQDWQLNYLTSATDVHRRTKKSPQTGNDSSKQFSLGLSASYEVDLWGRLEAQETAALYDAVAAAEGVNSAAMTLTALLAESWLELRLQWSLEEIVNEQVETNKKILSILENRQSRGMATAVDVFQQEEALARVEAELPLFERNEKILINKINVLLGRSPQSKLDVKRDASLPKLGALPLTGLPADLLMRRPDLRTIEANLRSREWSLTTAKTAKLPNLVIGGDFAFANDDVDYLFENWSRNIAANLVGPILDGDRRDSEIERQKARVDEILATYKSTFYQALADVEDSLIQEETQVRHLAAKKRQYEAAGKALEEATQRYLKGLNDFLPIIIETLNSQQLQVEVRRQEFEKLRFRIGLYRALGGGPTLIDVDVAQNTSLSKGENK